MTSEELVLALEGPQNDEGAEAGEAGKGRFFIFSVGASRFALAPEAIREIISDLEIFPLPACPPYVSGLINCHGTPCTVFDLRVLFENERQKAAHFLILNLEDDDVALGCTDVDEIVELPLSQVSSFAEKDAEARFCELMLELEGERIPVLSIAHMQRQLESDLA
jgi:chemotaxis signal transduction protein